MTVTAVHHDPDRRVVHVRLDVDRRVAATVNLRRSRRRLARERAVGLGPGTHDLDLRVHRLARRGPAQLTVEAAGRVEAVPVELR